MLITDQLLHILIFIWMLFHSPKSRSSRLEMFCEKGVLENLLPEAGNFIEKETLAQVSSCEFCEIFKNTFFIEQLW